MTPLPYPPLVRLPSSDSTRQKWIGLFVRVGLRHMKPPHPNHPERERILKNQKEYKKRGIGSVLDVGRSGWFLIRWEDGLEEQQNKIDLDVYPDREAAAAYRQRLFPRRALTDAYRAERT